MGNHGVILGRTDHTSHELVLGTVPVSHARPEEVLEELAQEGSETAWCGKQHRGVCMSSQQDLGAAER